MTGTRPGISPEWAERMRRAQEQELEAIRAGGGAFRTVSPDADTASVLGVNLMDGSRLLEVAEEGIRQGKAEADNLREFLTR